MGASGGCRTLGSHKFGRSTRQGRGPCSSTRSIPLALPWAWIARVSMWIPLPMPEIDSKGEDAIMSYTVIVVKDATVAVLGNQDNFDAAIFKCGWYFVHDI